MADDDLKVTGRVLEKNSKDSEEGIEPSWTKYSFNLQDTSTGELHWYSWFNAPLSVVSEIRTGQTHTFTYITKPNKQSVEHPYRNIQAHLGKTTDDAPDPSQNSSQGDPDNVPAANQPDANIISDPRQTNIHIGMATNIAASWIVPYLDPALPPGPTDIKLLRELRDQIYHGVTSVNVAPLHYCYTHEEYRKQTPEGGWVHHMDEGGFCPENAEIDGA